MPAAVAIEAGETGVKRDLVHGKPCLCSMDWPKVWMRLERCTESTYQTRKQQDLLFVIKSPKFCPSLHAQTELSSFIA
jgi:hypothetical protein